MSLQHQANLEDAVRQAKFSEFIRLIDSDSSIENVELFSKGYDAIGIGVVTGESQGDILKVLHATKEIGLKCINDTVESNGEPLTPNLWSRCFHIAVISKDKQAIQQLLALSDDAFEADSLNGLQFAITQLLKAAYKNDNDAWYDALVKTNKLANAKVDAWYDALVKTNKLANAKVEDDTFAPFIIHIIYPELDLYHKAFADSGSEAFNETLADGIVSHRNFWIDKVNDNDTQEWLPMKLICASMIVSQVKGYDITVDSDILPMWLM